LCTLILLRRPDDPHWPLLMAANRDELASRPRQPPGRHWPDRPEIVAGLDELSGGSWQGLNDHGVVAAVLNRPGTLGPEAGKRSRGELVLEALDHADAADAASALHSIDPTAYRPFNLIIADARDAFWLRGAARIDVKPLPPGFSMVTAHDVNDAASPRIRRYLPLFRTAQTPAPEQDDWSGWQLLLGSRASETGDIRDAMCIVTDGDYGTLGSSLVALPPYPSRAPVWLYADGPPDRTPFEAVATAADG
jgi:uncharacterized protein with NRDE domain